MDLGIKKFENTLVANIASEKVFGNLLSFDFERLLMENGYNDKTFIFCNNKILDVLESNYNGEDPAPCQVAT